MSTKANILVVCHDAGGAEVVSAFVSHYQKKFQFYCVAEGPAEKIFKRKNLQHLILKKTSNKNCSQILAGLPSLKYVLTGTSWTTSRELDFVKAAKALKIKTNTYLDHWVHYRERFGWPHRGWKKNLPDELWVGDRPALHMAKKLFTQPVRLVPSFFFKEIQSVYKQASKHKKSAQGILIATEPITLPMNYLGDRRAIARTELQIVDEMCRFLVSMKYAQPVMIRVHPAEKPGKYDAIIKKYRNELSITRSREPDMFKDLARAGTVIGMESMFLVVAWLCGKKTVSFLPDPMRHCPLPFSGIKKIKKIEDLAKLLLTRLSK